MKEAVTVHYLSIDAEKFSGTSPLPNGWRITRCAELVGELHSFFYRWVGGDWGWTDKLSLSAEAWQEHAEACELWIIYQNETPAGYFELAELSDSVELQYFGLAPHAVGLGAGGPALEFAIAQGLEKSSLVTVNTCSWDHPAALPNYLSRGFEEHYQEVEWRES
ncbi:GNAT family N-acetyltransferase [uncultured Umboniibacter sp.]|uniref:GNAT family N-acetyltransferase n=1 Tax=uncultured Umboniibacter sp. TaxID=1798917 RepID=UPI00260CE8E3|nr:GNAT family N-acetyltransferase [uncultured Umboniibacter sp.]